MKKRKINGMHRRGSNGKKKFIESSEDVQLRQHAEAINREKIAPESTKIAALSLEQSQELIHELRVHQIELEMQKEALLASREQAEISQSRYFNLYNLSPVAYSTLSDSGLIIQSNLTTSVLLGISTNALYQQPLAQYFIKEDQDKFYLFCKAIQRHKNDTISPCECELQIRRADGTQLWVNLTGIYTQSEDNKPELQIVLNNVTDTHNNIDEIRRLAFFDPLTGLPNRRLLFDRLAHAVTTSARTNLYCAVMLLDLDNFKILNDSMGHGLGDLLLQKVSLRLKMCMREDDTLARLGGDEFVILLENLSSDEKKAVAQAEVVTQKILVSLVEDYNLQGFVHNSTASIGIVMFKGDDLSFGDLLKNADVAMYQAKAASRNTFRFFDPVMQAIAERRTQLENALRQGLVQEEFVLNYQIQTNSNGKTTGVESLVRWINPEYATVSTGEFIALAEETDIIFLLGQWVLETACAQLAAWSQHPTMSSWSMSVNVSALQFKKSSFVGNVETALEKSDANPNLLILELTESMLVDDVPSTIEKMKRIKSLGVRFSLDDFGTGFSSLAYLKRLPLDQLKIDQSFVHDLIVGSDDAAICETIITLGISLGICVIAEGVETADQYECLMEMGCKSFQGYYFGRPTVASTFAD